jgi:hypothetical protein
MWRLADLFKHRNWPQYPLRGREVHGLTNKNTVALVTEDESRYSSLFGVLGRAEYPFAVLRLLLFC